MCIPGDGMATTNVAQVEDMAKMMCLSVENDAAFGGLFNCVSDKGVSDQNENQRSKPFDQVLLLYLILQTVL